MALDLNERQIAILAEIGVRAWSPPRKQDSAVDVEVIAPPEPGIEAMVSFEPNTWEGLKASVRSCRACGLCGAGNDPWAPQQARTATWMVVRDMPAGPGAALGDEEMLLDRMLKAVGRSRNGEGGQGAYLTHAMKCRPLGGAGPGDAELAACREHLRQEVSLLQPRMILGMGRFAARALLASRQPLGALRGQVHQFNGVPVVATYPVAYLLRHPLEKAKAWADLCLAADGEILMRNM